MLIVLLLITILTVVNSYGLHGDGEVQQNIRHGRSRARLLRANRHGEEVHQVVTTPMYASLANTNNYTYLMLDYVNDRTVDEEEGVVKSSVVDTTLSGTDKGNSSYRRITVDANFSTNTNSSWQHLDKSVMYMGDRALNQSSKKRKVKGSKEQEQKGHQDARGDFEAEVHDLSEPQIPDSFMESDRDFEDQLDIELSSEKTSTESVRSGLVDIVTRFLRIVESQHLLGENCTAGTDLNLGEGVVDRYAQERFRVEADVAVNRANMLTRLWKYADHNVVLSEYLLHASVFSMVEFDDDIFAAGNCYDQFQYKDYWLFCPYAYRLPEGTILVKDLAVEYKYLSNTSEWFYIARKNAENVIRNYKQFSRGIIGCIDGTHIPITAPKEHHNSYINRKNFHSVLLQGVCDNRMLFTNVYAGEPGSIHDYTLYKKSDLYSGIVARQLTFYDDNHIIGDLAYKLSTNLMVGFKNNGHLTDDQKNFNKCLSKSRVKIENAYALLKGRFRRLKMLETVRLDLTALLIISACVLHNICITNGDLLEGFVNIDEERAEERNQNPHNLIDMDEERERNDALQKRIEIMTALPVMD